MLKRRILLSTASLLLLGSLVTAMAQQETVTGSGWPAVQEAIGKGLPKTAIEKLEPIIADALANKQYAEAIRAISTKVSLEGSIEGNKPEEKVTRMRAAIDAAPAEMKPVMEAILANWYWHYFQQNRWRFQQRTQTDSAPSDDFTTWDLVRLLAEVDKQFDRAFAASDTLKATPISAYEKLLDAPNTRQDHRPTMFDVIAHNALEFYSAGEQGAAIVQDPFVLEAIGPIFGSREDFVNWAPQTTDEDSLLLRAVQLYQELLRFHAGDEDKTALLDADLLRLEFGNNHATGEEKQERFIAALRRFEQATASHPISTRALHLLANEIRNQGDLVEARKIAQQGLARFPNSVGANRCHNLIQEIEAKSLSVTTERVWNDPWPTIDVHYRNLTKIHFRLIPYDFDAFVKGDHWSPEHINHDRRGELARIKPVKAWSADLPPTADYAERIEKLPTPTDVKPGSYFLLASDDPSFKEQVGQVSVAEVWVSKLAMVIRTQQGQGVLEGFVLDAKSGEPLSGATVRGWQRTNDNQLNTLPSIQTDKNGLFRFPAMDRNRLIVQASHGGHSLATANQHSVYTNRNQAETIYQTQFFTDRSIYRPGQIVHYKGICYSTNTDRNQYEVMPQEALVVVFTDPNGKEIERVKHVTNAYGSFSGSVNAPRDRLMGQMMLRVEGAPNGQAYFSVEEYKRPKFRTELEAPAGDSKLGGEVKLSGTATAYTGVPISDAKVSWRVVREVRYPVWWYWSRWWLPSAPMASAEIAHGTSTTTANGKFDVSFTAKPDPTVDRSSEPTFSYTIYADVTDTTGETRSAQRSIQLGYTTLQASMTADSWLTSDEPIEITINTTSLNGEGRPAKGTVKVYRLQQPATVIRPELSGHHVPFPGPLPGAAGAAEADPPVTGDPNSWPLGDVVMTSEFTTDASGKTSLKVELDPGVYRAVLETRDSEANEVKALLPIQVVDPDAKRFSPKLANLVLLKEASLEPGEKLAAIWATGYDKARAFIEIEHRGKLLQSYWTDPARTQVLVNQDITEALRGGFTLRVTMVRENRAHITSHQVDVPWSNKELSIKWERFVSKLTPGQKESWTAVISGPDAERAAAEMVATLYDASLDAFRGHGWMASFPGFYRDYSRLQIQFENTPKLLNVVWSHWPTEYRDAEIIYPHLPYEIIANLIGYQFYDQRMMRKGRMAFGGGMGGGVEMAMADGMAMPLAAAAPAPAGAMEGEAFALGQTKGQSNADRGADKAPGETPSVDLENVSARKNLNETAFFFPHVVAGKDGTVRLEFEMPEALTEWKFMGFAHDTKLRSARLTDSVVTSKDLMVQPNPPRFMREGDTLEFTVKVSNRSATRQAGTVRLTLSDARSNDSVDDRLGNSERDKAFDLAAGESKTFAWRLSVPEGLGFLTYKAVGSSGRVSDGEEGFLPILSRRVLVTESISLPIRGNQTKEFTFDKLVASGNSKTLKHESLTVQMVSNPSWYAVMALPYLMEYPYECSEQVFNRLYANALARHIATSDPKIEQIFAQWRATPALDSPLEKNEDLKSVMLEETPWYRQAQAESQARRNVGVLFESNRVNTELERALAQLVEAQNEDGAWPWFPGGRGDDYITLYITTGFGRLRHLGTDIDTSAAIRSLDRLDAWVTKMYDDIKPVDRDKNHLSTTIALYLYGRSFFLADKPIADEHRTAINYWLGQSETHWLALGHRQSQAHLAVALKRFDKPKGAEAIMASIKERSVTDEELGMFWRDTELSWWWYRAPIETQAMMIEAFDEVVADAEAVEECKVWLIKQKQTQDWKTTKATADAIYALLLRGTDVLASDKLVQVSLGGEAIVPDTTESGTGFYEEKFRGGEIQPDQGNVTVTKVDEGVAWGSLHWQYLEDISAITPHEGTPLTLTKQLYVKRNTPKGPTLERVAGPVAVGDELVVRVVVKTDRDMEYVHLKDHRGSGTEPVNVLSHYKYQDGLGYYESTRDTASHFFIDYLPKGTYVFEYSTRVQLRGEYQTGMANIQCMYAPEFNSHSESLPIVVQ